MFWNNKREEKKLVTAYRVVVCTTIKHWFYSPSIVNYDLVIQSKNKISNDLNTSNSLKEYIIFADVTVKRCLIESIFIEECTIDPDYDMTDKFIQEGW